VTVGPAAVGRVVVETGLAVGDEIALRDPLAVAGDDASPSASSGSSSALPGDR
jgi:hypothetical protein